MEMAGTSGRARGTEVGKAALIRRRLDYGGQESARAPATRGYREGELSNCFGLASDWIGGA
jgi:hypothetical protein